LISFFQDIDGQALLLLNEEKLHNLLGIKMGPAMKIAQHIRNLTLQHIIEKHCHMQHIPIALTLVSAYECLNIVENTFRSEFLFNNLIICCGTENF